MRPILVMRGGSGGTAALRLDNATYTRDRVDPLNSLTQFMLETSGVASQIADTTASYYWITGGTPSNYEARATPTIGSGSSGVFGSWVPLSSNVAWTVERTIPGTKTCTMTVDIGLLGTSTALKTATITLSATVSA